VIGISFSIFIKIKLELLKNCFLCVLQLLLTPFFFVHFSGLGSSIHAFNQSLPASAPTNSAVITSLQLILNYFFG